MGQWLLREELASKWGSERLLRLAQQGIDPGALDPEAQVAARIEAAIADAEQQARAVLLQGSCLAAAQLPQDPAQAAPNLKRLVGDLAIWQLQKTLELQEPAIATIRDAALGELRQIATSRSLGLILAAPAAPSCGLGVLTRTRGPRADPPLKLEDLRW